MDIRKQAVTETSTLHLRNAADDLMYDDEARTKPVQIVVYGPGSRPFQAAQAAQNGRAMERLRRKGKMQSLSADETAAENTKFLTAITVEFRHIEFDALQGTELHRAVYSDPSLGFIGDQVQKHVGDWANFSPASLTA